MKKTEWERNCPECNKKLQYSSKDHLVRAIKKNSLCCSCNKIGNKNPFFGKGYLIKGNLHPMYGKKHKKETIQKMKENHKDTKGKNNPMFGKSVYNVWLEKYGKEIADIKLKSRNKKCSKKLKGKIAWSRGLTKETDDRILKMSMAKIGKSWPNPNKGKTYEEIMGKNRAIKLKRNKRISHIKWIETNKNNGNQIYPIYNSKSIPILEQKAKELGISDLKHAENGGEYYIKELGYWVDGYSPSKNVVIEYYEPFHKKQTEKDKRRKQEIKYFLKCKFIEIKTY